MEKKLTKKTLHKVMMRWYHGATTCGSYAMMCMLGYACAMFPALKELYPDVEERKQRIITLFGKCWDMNLLSYKRMNLL